MGGPGSGPRKRGKRRVASARLPALGSTEQSISAHMAAVSRGLAAGEISPLIARELAHVASVALRAIARAAETREIEQLRVWRDELRALSESAATVVTH